MARASVCVILGLAAIAAPGFAAKSKPTSPKPTSPKATSQKAPAKVDLNIFHKEGSRWYGKTKEGKWMTEEDALKAGARAAKSD